MGLELTYHFTHSCIYMYMFMLSNRNVQNCCCFSGKKELCKQLPGFNFCSQTVMATYIIFLFGYNNRGVFISQFGLSSNFDIHFQIFLVLAHKWDNQTRLTGTQCQTQMYQRSNSMYMGIKGSAEKYFRFSSSILPLKGCCHVSRPK